MDFEDRVSKLEEKYDMYAYMCQHGICHWLPWDTSIQCKCPLFDDDNINCKKATPRMWEDFFTSFHTEAWSWSLLPITNTMKTKEERLRKLAKLREIQEEKYKKEIGGFSDEITK